MTISLRSRQGRWVLASAVLGSGIAGIDSTVVNIALPAIGRSFHAGFATLQWTVTAYTLTLAALILLGGSLGDRFGRRRIFVIGLCWFAAASALCAVAPDVTALVVARALQGVGGALLTPASLAILESTFAEGDRAAAIGAWAGLSGTTSAVAPFLGGWLLAAGSWRWVFLINPPLAVAVAVVALRHVPETVGDADGARVDVAGAALGVIGLGGITGGILGASGHAIDSSRVLIPGVVGLTGLGAFLAAEHRGRHPLLPLSLFRSRQFSAANAVTLLLYSANGAALLLLVVALQTVTHFSPLEAGTSLLPVTAVMLLLASRSGALAQRIGPRPQMATGPLVAAGGLLLLTHLSRGSHYLTGVLPGVTVFGLGLAIFVAPLTATVLGAVPEAHAGVASGVNNAVARTAGLLSVAAIPVIAGLTGDAYAEPAVFLEGFRRALFVCAILLAAGGILALATTRNASVSAYRRVAQNSPPIQEPIGDSELFTGATPTAGISSAGQEISATFGPRCRRDRLRPRSSSFEQEAGD